MSTENFSSLFVTVVTYVPFNSFILVEIRDSLSPDEGKVCGEIQAWEVSRAWSGAQGEVRLSVVHIIMIKHEV